MAELKQDVRDGLRLLARNPAFTLVATLTLALGIGATSAIFSVLDAVVLRPLPSRDPERLVFVQGVDPQGRTRPPRAQTLVEWTFKGPERLSLGLTLPPGQPSIDATVRVSRTWQPSTIGDPDTTNLGVGVSADSVQSQERARSAQIPLDLAPC